MCSRDRDATLDATIRAWVVFRAIVVADSFRVLGQRKPQQIVRNHNRVVLAAQSIISIQHARQACFPDVRNLQSGSPLVVYRDSYKAGSRREVPVAHFFFHSHYPHSVRKARGERSQFAEGPPRGWVAGGGKTKWR